MTRRLEGKVAFITGAGRGQGRAHAVRTAEEGADIIAVDICHDIESNRYLLASPEDLAETERLVKERGGRIIAQRADVRERAELREALDAGLAGLGRLDIVVANAGIMPMTPAPAHAQEFVDATDVDLIGVMHTVAISHGHLGEHGSIVLTGSTAGMITGAAAQPAFVPGGAGYQWSKQVLQQYTEQMALHLAHRSIRVNGVHPTNCNTHLPAQPGDIQGVPPGPRRAHPRGCGADFLLVLRHADPVRRARGHRQPGRVHGSRMSRAISPGSRSGSTLARSLSGREDHLRERPSKMPKGTMPTQWHGDHGNAVGAVGQAIPPRRAGRGGTPQLPRPWP
jgi:NAD(P)-dependent dehydrogenase (short-subunit alcohol dehydrogenase family)